MIHHCCFKGFCCGFIKCCQSVEGMKQSGSLNAAINSFSIKQLTYFPSPTSMKALLQKRKAKILLVYIKYQKLQQYVVYTNIHKSFALCEVVVFV